jgi:AraC-like DNA-binding protein
MWPNATFRPQRFAMPHAFAVTSADFMARPLFASPLARRRFLNLDELRPSVDLVGKWHFDRQTDFHYRIPSFHLLLLDAGKIRAKTPQESFEAVAGDLICFGPTQHNQYQCAAKSVFYQAHLQFAPPPNHQLAPMLGGHGTLPVRVSLGEAYESARAAFEVICAELNRPGAAHQLRVTGAMFELLAIVSDVLGEGTEAATATLDPWQRVRLQLESNLDAPLSIAQLAREMGVTSDYLARRFKRRFGMSPNEYRVQFKLSEAARQLRATSMPIKAIAYALGFGDPRSFARSFRRHLGVKPSDLRRSMQPGAAIDEAPAGLRMPPRGDLFRANRHILPPNISPASVQRYHHPLSPGARNAQPPPAPTVKPHRRP